MQYHTSHGEQFTNFVQQLQERTSTAFVRSALFFLYKLPPRIISVTTTRIEISATG